MNKKKWNRRMLIGLIICFLLGSGCHAAVDSAETNQKIKVIATIFPQYDFIREIAGDRVELSMLIKPGVEYHSYEPSPQDIISIQECDLFIYVGGESDAWVDAILESAPSAKRTDVALMDLVELEQEAEHDHEAENEHDSPEEHDYDEHVWTSPVNVMTIVSELSDTLCKIDADNQTYYQDNARAYLQKLEELDAQFREATEQAKRNKLIFGDRFPLTYFVKEYGLEYSAAFPGCASETEPSAAVVAQLVREIVQEDIPVVFYIEMSNHQLADMLAEQTGAKAELFYTCHNVSIDDFEAGKCYLDLMGSNVERLREALNE